MIEFRNVSASYEDETPVLKGVSFTIEKGSFVAFVGTNGAGKSTTMRLINGLLAPKAGEVLLDGVSTAALRTSELARKVGFLFQNPDRQICCNTVREEIMFSFEAQGRSRDEAEAKVGTMIEHFGFDPNAEPFLLNRGTRQLLALASVLAPEPDILVLDEPTTGLDFRECCKVMEIIAAAHASGTTVVMVCHDMEVVADYAQRAIAMNEGCIVADDAPFALFRDPAALEAAHLVPPQICALSMQLIVQDPTLRETPIAQANTLEEMQSSIEAVRAERNARKTQQEGVC